MNHRHVKSATARAGRFLGRNAIGLLALFVALGTGSYALAGSGGGSSTRTLYACVTKDFGTLNLTTAHASCPNGERRVSWNSKGRRGASGKQGPKGVKGNAGPKGDTGARGEAGLEGPAGPRGETGPEGPPGSDAQFDGAAAGGDLSGTYPNPSIASGSIGPADLTPLGSALSNSPPRAAVPVVARLHVETGLVSGETGTDTVIYNGDAPGTFEVADAWVVEEASGLDMTWQLRTATGGGGSELTKPLALGLANGEIERASWLARGLPIFQGGSLVVRCYHEGAGNSGATFDIYVLLVPTEA